MAEALFVRRLKQAGAQCAVNFYGRADDLLGEVFT